MATPLKRYWYVYKGGIVPFGIAIAGVNMMFGFIKEMKSGQTNFPTFLSVTAWCIGKGVIYGITWHISVPIVLYDSIASLCGWDTFPGRHILPLVLTPKFRQLYRDVGMLESGHWNYSSWFEIMTNRC